MAYAMMNKTTNWMPLKRHKRSQNAGVAYTLVDELVAVVDALMTTSSNTLGACAAGIERPLVSKPVSTPAVLVRSADRGLGCTDRTNRLSRAGTDCCTAESGRSRRRSCIERRASSGQRRTG